MYKNLEAELRRKGLTKGNLAKALNMTATTLSNKLNGKSEVSLKDAMLIRSIVCATMSIEELFAESA